MDVPYTAYFEDGITREQEVSGVDQREHLFTEFLKPMADHTKVVVSKSRHTGGGQTDLFLFTS